MSQRIYEATVEEISIVEGVEVDIAVRGDEDRAEKVMMDLKERLGVVAAAFDQETAPEDLPEDLTDIDDRYVPLMTVAWDRLFDDEGSDGGGASA